MTQIKFTTDIELVERYCLIASTFRITTEVIEKATAPNQPSKKRETKEKISSREFFLKEISIQELKSLRKTKIPSFVLKENIGGVEHYWHAKVPYNLNFTSSNLIGTHQCSPSNTCCARLSAASDEAGGCSKVRHMARFIELYPWIPFGYETFNTKNNTFMVAKCEHFIPYDNKYREFFKAQAKKASA